MNESLRQRGSGTCEPTVNQDRDARGREDAFNEAYRQWHGGDFIDP